jgi:flagellar hook-associated protein 1 FlgK
VSGSGFSTLNTAISGLAAAQRAMDATSQNIVNANTTGYSRQRVELNSVGTPPGATLHTGTSTTLDGVQITAVTRVKDAFIEATRAAAGGRQATLDAQTNILTGAQNLLAEPGSTGLQSTLDSFYSSWHDLANTPTDPAAGSVVIERGAAVAEQLKTVSDGISAEWTTANNNLIGVVAQTNQAASDLANLNDAIMKGQAAGQPVNEMLDKRDTIVRNLVSLVGATSSVDAEGRASVSVAGVNLVSGSNANTLTLTGSTDVSTASATSPALSIGSFTVSPDSGTAAGLLATMHTDLPTLSAKVDAVASGIITAVNTTYGAGYATDGSTGQAFFSGTNAQTIAVVPTDGSTLAIASAPNTVDGSIAMNIGDLANDVTSAAVLGTTGPSAQWRDLTSSLGVQIQSLQTAQSVQSSVVAAADDAVTSDSGVNLDEEMTNMMLYQRSYEASAKCITTADSLLDTLINKTLI